MIMKAGSSANRSVLRTQRCWLWLRGFQGILAEEMGSQQCRDLDRCCIVRGAEGCVFVYGDNAGARRVTLLRVRTHGRGRGVES